MAAGKQRFKEGWRPKGGGLAVLVDNRWCPVIVKCHLCSPDIELWAVIFCPYYFLRQFTRVVLATVYIPPPAFADTVFDAQLLLC